jgi:glycosylphosphatidylinositol transamidase
MDVADEWVQTGLPTTIILNTAFLPLFTSFLLPPSPPTSSLTSTLKSFTLIAGGLGIAVVATLNFGLSLFLSLLLFLPLSLVSPRPSPIASRIQQVLLLLASPPVLWSLWKLAAKGDGAESWAREVLREYHTTSSWTLPVVFQFVVPLLLQASTLSLL